MRSVRIEPYHRLIQRFSVAHMIQWCVQACNRRLELEWDSLNQNGVWHNIGMETSGMSINACGVATENMDLKQAIGNDECA